MKKIMMMLALTLTLTTSFAFAGETTDRHAVNTFNSDFAGATDVAWTVGKNYLKVAFTMNDQKLFAFYDGNGEFIAVTRFISSTQLPNNLKKSLKRSVGTSWISDLFEVTSGEQTDYYVTIENADTKIVLESRDGSKWSLYQKSDKQ